MLANDELPEDWSIPTFRGVSEPVTMLGVPPEQAALSIFLGGGTGVLLLITAGVFYALPAALVLIPSLFFLFRSLFASDPYWAEHLTTHRYPADVYLGK